MKPPDINLGRFLVKLAVDEELRAKFEESPEDTLADLSPRLRFEVEDAIIRTKGAKLFNLLNIANQSTGASGDAPSKKSTKKSTKKTAKKSSPK